MVHTCPACSRRFGTARSLQQHINSPAHASTHECGQCERVFGSDDALQQHLNSPAHATTYECRECERVFGSDDALQQHLNSPIHATTYECRECERVFGGDDALQQHLRSPRHRAPSPLDQFFLSFTGFDYNPLAAPSQEFDRLRRFHGWERKDVDGEKAWSRYMNALVLEFNSWYGKDSRNLRSWQNLCKVIQISPVPQTCGGCCKAVRSSFVNMIDLLHYSRGNIDEIHIFPDLESLRVYTKGTRRIFPRDSLQAGALLKHLLREIFGS